MGDSVRVLIADDHPLFREGMRGRPERVADVAVVGEAASGEEAVELAHKLEPDVILMDIKMPALNGIEATREIHKASPQIGVLVLTMFEDDDSVFAAMRAGAPRQEQSGDSPRAFREPEDCWKPRLQHPAQAAGGRQGAGCHPRSRRRDGNRWGVREIVKSD
jgi:CheY-like chemotaxis protein